MNDTAWTIASTISITCSVMLLVWDRGWLRPVVEVLRHPVRTVTAMLHNMRVMLRG